jgi:hypothetical protein
MQKLGEEAATDSRADRTRADMEAFLPQLIAQLQAMTSAIEKVVAASEPILDAAKRLEAAVPRLN